MTTIISGPMAERKETAYYKSASGKDGAHYNIFHMNPETSMDALRETFPDGECDEMNLVLFSTSGVHGTYTTIEEVETSLKKYGEDAEFEDESPEDYYSPNITILIIHPRIVCMRYGNLNGVKLSDIQYLKKLRASSRIAMAKIG